MKKFLVNYDEKVKLGRKITNIIHHNACECANAKKEIREYYKLCYPEYKIISIEELKED